MTPSFYIAIVIASLLAALAIALFVFGIRMLFKKEAALVFWRNPKLSESQDQIVLSGWKKNLYATGLILLGYLVSLIG